MNMSGKKVVGIFIVSAVICSIGMGLWMKQAYDTRPQIKIEDTKIETKSEAAPETK